MLRAAWYAGEAMRVMYAMVVACPCDGHEDSINTKDTHWKCPECKRTWRVDELRRVR